MDAPSTLAKPLFSIRLRWQYALPPSQDFLRVRPSHGAAQSATRLITAHSSCSRDDAIGEGILAAQTHTYIQAETGLKSICHWARSIVIRVISVDLGMSASRLVRRHSRKCRLSGSGGQGTDLNMIQAPKPGLRILRYELRTLNGPPSRETGFHFSGSCFQSSSAATASISISQSGRARRLTTTSVPAGGFSTFT